MCVVMEMQQIVSHPHKMSGNAAFAQISHIQFAKQYHILQTKNMKILIAARKLLDLKK